MYIQNTNCEDKFLVAKIIYHRLPCITVTVYNFEDKLFW